MSGEAEETRVANNNKNESLPIDEDINITPRQQPVQGFTVLATAQDEDPDLLAKPKNKPKETSAGKRRTPIIAARSGTNKKGPKKKVVTTPGKRRRDGDPNWKTIGVNLDNPNN